MTISNASSILLVFVCLVGIVSAATECYFPQPAQGQSLMSFLSSRDFERIPELDRVCWFYNVHCEHIIGATCRSRSSTT